MVYQSRFPRLDIPEMPMVDFIFQNIGDHRHRTALVDGITGRSLTYAELAAAVDSTAAGLSARGLRKGDVCGIYSPNVLEYAVVFLAVVRAGGTISTINPLYTVTELTHQLRDCGAKFLVTTPRLLATARQSAQAGPSVESVFTIGRAGNDTPLSALQVDLPGGPPRTDVSTDDVAVLPYSSGTTGLPKGVMLTHRNIVANVAQIEAIERLGRDEVLIATLPFYHIYGMVVVLLHGLRVGATLVVLSRFKTQLFLQAIERYRVTTAYLVPPIVRTLATSTQVHRYDLSSLRDVISAAAPLPDRTARTCIERIKCHVRQLYGLTEASPVTHIAPRGETHSSSVGYVVSNTEFRIVGVARRRDVAQGQFGEVWVRGPQVMTGYLNNPEATAGMLDSDGWLHTGDIGFMDADGRLYVVDRAKELIKFRGLHYAEHELLRSMVEDIEARRGADDRVRSQALLLDSVRESVVASDMRHRITFWNRGAEALFGHRAEQALGHAIDTLIIPADDEVKRGWQSELGEVARNGTWQGQALRRRRDGSLLWTDVVVSMIVNASGVPSGYISIHRDITELRRNQEMLRDSREQLRNLASSLMLIREEERSAISREVHDELGQALTRLKIDLKWLTDRLPQQLQTERARSMHSLVDNMVKTVQHVSSQLRPAILDDLGLEAAIESHTKDFASWNDCRCELALSIADLKPQRDRDTAVFRIVQEALTNAARHSRAKVVSVRASADDGELAVDIEDNGVGIPSAMSESAHSLGLIGMRERAESLGGRLSVRARPRRGTVVSLRVPLAADTGNSRP
jgi:PAS domain S-box-containing protein